MSKFNAGSAVFWVCVLVASGAAFAGGYYLTMNATASVTTKVPEHEVAAKPSPTPEPTPTEAPTEAPGPLVEEPVRPVATPRAATPEPVAVATPEPTPDKEIFRVQVGPFDDRGTAEKQVQDLQAAGINAVVVYDGGQYQAQIGAFSDRSRAIAVADEVNVRGYPVTIRH